MLKTLLLCLATLLVSSAIARAGILFGVEPSFGGGLNRIDQSTGAATPIGGPFGFTSTQAADFDSATGTLYAVSYFTDLLYTVNTTTGVPTAVGDIGFIAVSGLAMDPNTNTLYGWDGFVNRLLRIDTATGAGTAIGFLGGDYHGLAFDPNTNTLYGASSFYDQLFVLNTTTAAATPVGSAGSLGFLSVQGLTFDPEHNILYGWDADQNMLITIDTTTGVGTAVGSTGSEIAHGLAYEPAAVPEPASMATLAGGLIGLLALARVRRRR
jgi:hypothetical protein